MAMVLAVNWPGHEPAEGVQVRSIALSSAAGMVPCCTRPTASMVSRMVTWPLAAWPGRVAPPYRNTAGTFSRTMAIIMAGSVLSQPANATSAS